MEKYHENRFMKIEGDCFVIYPSRDDEGKMKSTEGLLILLHYHLVRYFTRIIEHIFKINGCCFCCCVAGVVDSILFLSYLILSYCSPFFVSEQ